MALCLVVDPKVGHQIMVPCEIFAAYGTGIRTLTSMLLELKI